MKYDPNLVVPVEVIQAVQTIRDFAAKHTTGNDWQIGGIGPIFDLQRQLAEVTRERDTLKAMVDLHDALNDRRRAQAALQGADRRVRYDR